MKVAVLYNSDIPSSVMVAEHLESGNEVFPVILSPGPYASNSKHLKSIRLSLLDYGLVDTAKWIMLQEFPEEVSSVVGILLALAAAREVGAEALYLPLITEYSKGIPLWSEPLISTTFGFYLNIVLNTPPYNTLSQNNVPKILAPYQHFYQSKVVALGELLKVDFSKTVSCTDPTLCEFTVLHCGKCKGCLSRQQSFVQSKVSDTTYWLSK